MTKAAIRSAFRKLDASEQAEVLRDLAETLARSLSDEDRRDAQTIQRRRQEEPQARPWADVRERVQSRRSGQRPGAR